MTHALVAEPYSSNKVRVRALGVVIYSEDRVTCAPAACSGGTVTSRRGRETHRHDYTRPPALLSGAVGGLSTSLRIFASPSLILSTESVVMVEWKGMARATLPVDAVVDVEMLH